MNLKSGLFLVGCTFALASCAVAPAEHWEPYSTSAMAITGKVAFSPRRIVFQDGSRLPLAFVGADMLETESGARQADIYRVTSRKRLRLINRNTFCDPAAQYLAVIRDGGRPGTAIAGDYNDRKLIVFFGEPQHKPSTLCAIYNYENKPEK